MASLATSPILAERAAKGPAWTKAVLTFLRQVGDVIAEARELRRTMHKKHPFVEF